MSVYNLFLDFETSGLDPRATWVFEAGWTVTDAEFDQLTPLRSRFLALSTSSTPLLTTEAQRPAFWSNLQPQVVRDMHANSRLGIEYRRVPAYSIVGSVPELDRLLFDDLQRAGVADKDTVHLAGLGVGHYDRPVLDALGSVVAAEVLHYRAADVSAAGQVLGIDVRTPEALLQFCDQVSRLPEQPLTVRGLSGLLADETSTRLVKFCDDGTPVLDFEELIDHRAADDVAFGLVLGRAMQAATRRLSKIPV